MPGTIGGVPPAITVTLHMTAPVGTVLPLAGGPTHVVPLGPGTGLPGTLTIPPPGLPLVAPTQPLVAAGTALASPASTGILRAPFLLRLPL
jgi:hypothetical protein